jgi:phage-related minor tail protein
MFGSWKLVRVVLKNALISFILCTLVFAILGYLLAGPAGLQNMAVWGAILGLLAGTFTGAAMMMGKYHEEVGQNFSRWVEAQETKEKRES